MGNIHKLCLVYLSDGCGLGMLEGSGICLLKQLQHFSQRATSQAKVDSEIEEKKHDFIQGLILHKGTSSYCCMTWVQVISI